MKYAMAIFMLLILLMACQPAVSPVPPTPAATPVPSPVTPPTSSTILPPPVVQPKIVEKVTTFEAVKYSDPTYQFSVDYPAGWIPTPTTLKGGVFYAKGPGGNFVHIAVRPAITVRDAAITYLSDLIASTGISLSPNIDSEKAITLADGTQADVILLSASLFQVKAAVTGIMKDGKAIMVCGARDPKNLELYEEIGSTLIVQTMSPNTSLAQPCDNNTTQVVPTQATSLKVLFDHQGMVYSTDIDGSDLKRISRSSDMSPDGKTYVFAKKTEYNNYRWLYFSNSDKTNEWPIFPVGGGGADYAFPVWSPDGSNIAFSKSRTIPVMSFLTYDMWIINPDGTSPTKISDSVGSDNTRSVVCPQWFPDSKKVVYASNEDGYWQIYYTPIYSYEPHLIVKLQQKFSPGWFPWDYEISQDGKRMIYRDGPGTDLKTLVIDINSKKIVEWPNIDISEISPVLSQDGNVTVLTKSDGLYYTDNSHKEPLKILSTAAGDIAMGFTE